MMQTYGYGRVLAAASPRVGKGHLLVAAEEAPVAHAEDDA
jgi:hypothetical protein